MILYDRYRGLGYSERGFQQMPQLLAICLEMVRGLPMRGRLPELRRPAQSATWRFTAPGPDARLPDAEQTGDRPAAGLCARFGSDDLRGSEHADGVDAGR